MEICFPAKVGVASEDMRRAESPSCVDLGCQDKISAEHLGSLDHPAVLNVASSHSNTCTLHLKKLARDEWCAGAALLSCAQMDGALASSTRQPSQEKGGAFKFIIARTRSRKHKNTTADFLQHEQLAVTGYRQRGGSCEAAAAGVGAGVGVRATPAARLAAIGP